MNRTMQAWEEVGDRFSALATDLRARLRAVGAPVLAQRKEVVRSVTAWASAMQDALRAVGRSVRDPIVRDDVTRTVASMRNAVSTGLDETVEQVRARLPRAQPVTAKPRARAKEAARTAPRKKATSAAKRTPAA